MNFDQWWNEDYDDKDNPFEKDSFGYWAYAGWCAALAQPEQDAIAWMWKDGTITTDPDYADGTWTPLFAAPPSKPDWVSLTDDEKLTSIWRDGSFHHGVEWAEAKLKEKNT